MCKLAHLIRYVAVRSALTAVSVCLQHRGISEDIDCSVRDFYSALVKLVTSVPDLEHTTLSQNTRLNNTRS